MGFFTNLKNTMDNANAAALSANAMTQQFASAWQGSTPQTATDQIYAPIEGITLEMYAHIMGSLVKLNLPGVEAVTAYVETQGVAPGTWGAVQVGWTNRMAQSMDVRTRYGMLYSKER